MNSIMKLLFSISLLFGSVAVYPDTFPGGVYTWPLPPGVIDVRFNDKPVLQFADTAFVGIPMGQPLGRAVLKYQQGGEQHSHSFEVLDKTYTEQHIEIANKAMVDPPAETLKRIREESVRQKKLYNSFVADINLDDGFVIPVAGITTSLFGHRRFFNGKPRSPHSGLDLAADTGTPVMAAANAKVTLADDLYFNGNTIFLDHGQGLITMYCHLSALEVAVGDTVKQGQTIGLVGATGRVTGPHLHWSVSLGGVRVDPTVFMQSLNAKALPAGAETKEDNKGAAGD